MYQSFYYLQAFNLWQRKKKHAIMRLSCSGNTKPKFQATKPNPNVQNRLSFDCVVVVRGFYAYTLDMKFGHNAATDVAFHYNSNTLANRVIAV